MREILRTFSACRVFLVALAVACFPPTIQAIGAPRPLEGVTVLQAGDTLEHPAVGQYPAFMEYTDYARQSVVYAGWRRQVEACTGIVRGEKDAAELRWLVAATPLFRVNGSDLLAAAYFTEPRSIMVGLGFELDSATIIHELVHDALRLEVAAHPANMYDSVAGACGRIVRHGDEARKR